MSRIRTIKPEILEDEKTAGLSHEGFRLFIGIISLADDHGLLRADAAWLNGQVFWSTPARNGLAGVEERIDELAAADLIQLYEVRGQRYMSIRGWSKHQRVDHPSKPRVPPPSEEGAWLLKPKVSDYVYFIQATESGAIKIGISWNPLKRLLDVQNGHHEPLLLIGQFPGTIADERALHAEFAHLRLSGEWFRCDESLLAKITELSKSSGATDNPRDGRRGFSRERPTILAPDLDLGSGTTDLDSAARPPRKKSKHPLPADWQPTPEHEATARERGLDLQLQAQKFRLHAEANDRRQVSWNAAFSQWLLNSFPDRRPGESKQSEIRDIPNL